MIEFDSME